MENYLKWDLLVIGGGNGAPCRGSMADMHMEPVEPQHCRKTAAEEAQAGR